MDLTLTQARPERRPGRIRSASLVHEPGNGAAPEPTEADSGAA